MPKFSASARHTSHQDENKIKKFKHRGGHQYRDAAKARKLRQTRIKGVVEEVVEPIEPGKARPLRRGPKYDFAKIERKLRANCKESLPVSTPTAPAEIYGPNPVNFNVPRAIMPTSEATAKRKQAATSRDDGDTTDVDDSEDVIVVPEGFVEAAETLGLLSVPAASSSPRKELEETLHAQPDEKLPVAEHLSTKIEKPSPPLAVPETIYSAPSIQPYMVPESVLVDVSNESQITAATSSPTYLESSEPTAPTSVPQAASVPESFQESPASEHPNLTFWDNNMSDGQGFHIHQQNLPSAFCLGSTSGDVDMEFLGEATMEPPVCSLPTMWTSSQAQQTFYSYSSQAAENNNHAQTYTRDIIHPNWASMQFQPMQIETAQQSTQLLNYAVDPLTAALRIWTDLSGDLNVFQPCPTMPEITQCDEQRYEESSKLSMPNRLDSYQDIRQCPVNDNRGFNPFPNLKKCKNMRLINMSGELEESRVIQPGYGRLTKPPVGSEPDLINRLRREAEGHATPQLSKVKHGKRRREISQSDATRTDSPDFEIPPSQRRRFEPGASKLKAPVPVQKRSRKAHRRSETSSRTPTGWSLSRFCPSISSLVDRLFKFF